jgi:serine/threonine protein phosphatase PrpC
MAVRLQMKLGVVAEAERLEDSPDTVAVVEPTIGATTRSKGSLYIVVSGTGRARRLQEATRLVADTVQGEYYYDESAGLIACLEKSIRTANRKLAASSDRLGLGADSGSIGLGVAVVRGSELYVTTVGPVEAYLVHQAHLLTLPDPNADRVLPVDDLAPHIWRGEVAAGDTLVLVSRNIMAALGTDELKDALNTLHPQAAMEQVHALFAAAGGTGSDGAIAIEAVEISSTSQRGRLVPARPPEPLAGAPDRSPIPLADSVGGGVAAVSSGASRARSAAGRAAGGAVTRFQNLLPRRGARYRRVTPAATRRESQRRAAVAVLAFIAIAATLGMVLWMAGGSGSGGVIDEVTAGEKALGLARENLRLVFHNGADLVVDDPAKAEELLRDAHARLDEAAANGVPATTLRPLRAEVIEGLDDLYGVVDVAPRTAFSFEGQEQPFDLAAMVLGPDGVPYVLDRATKTVYRVDLRAKKATAVVRSGATVGAAKVGDPKLLATGGPDVVVVDSKNALWRWRPADSKGKGTLARIRVAESATWGADILAIGTYVRNADDGLYNLYVLDPSEQQILRYSPAQDGSGYPAPASGYLTTPQDVSAVTSMYIDGEVYLADGGIIERFVAGRSGDWSPQAPPDDLLRPAPAYRVITSPGTRGEGAMYGYDHVSDRIIAFDKASGKYQTQFRIAGQGKDWADLRAFFVVNRASGQAPVLYWIDAQSIGVATLQDISTPPTPPPAASGSPGASPAGSAKPTAKPKPTATPAP